MRKGFRIPLNLKEGEIESLGDPLLGSGLYDWIELKYPFDILGYDPDPYLKGVSELCRRYQPGISVHVPTNYDLGHWSGALRRATLTQITKTIQWASEMGATIMPIHPGTIFTMDIPSKADSPIKELIVTAAQKKKQRARQLTAEALGELADVAGEAGIVLAVENVLLPQEVIYSAAELNELVASVARNEIQALFDCGHAHRCGLDGAAFVRVLAKHLVHVHLNDNDGSADLHMQLGEGTIDYPLLMAALTEIGYTGAVVMETIYRDSADLVESARLVDQYSSSSR